MVHCVIYIYIWKVSSLCLWFAVAGVRSLFRWKEHKGYIAIAPCCCCRRRSTSDGGDLTERNELRFFLVVLQCSSKGRSGEVPRKTSSTHDATASVIVLQSVVAGLPISAVTATAACSRHRRWRTAWLMDDDATNNNIWSNIIDRSDENKVNCIKCEISLRLSSVCAVCLFLTVFLLELLFFVA